ncbi:MAG: AMP-binding protein [Pacificimonas sp.]
MSTTSDTPFWVLDHGDRTALITAAGEAVSYDTLAARADALAADLPEGPGFGFLLISPDVDSIALYLGALRAGRQVPLLLNADIGDDALAALSAHYRPNWIRGRDVGSALDGSADIHDNLALLLATSGSTGSPKLVRLSANAIASNAASIAHYLGLTPDDRAITTMPLAYSFGMSILNSHLAVGASLVLSDLSMLQPDFWTLAKTSGVTSLSGVPSSFDMLRRAKLETRGLDRLRMLTQAGGKLPDRLVSHFADLCAGEGWDMHVMYGQTEAAPRISHVPPDRLKDKVGSVGIAVPGGDISIADDTGELVYRGPNVMMGYAESREDLARGDDMGGILHTGDLARLDEDGFAYITGRLKRFIKLSGTRTNLDAVEAWAASRYGAPVAAGGEDEKLALWLTAKVGADDAAVKADLRAAFDIFPGMVRLARIDALPLTANGKTDYAALG